MRIRISVRIGKCYGLVLLFLKKHKKMKTYIFYITSRESKKTRQIQLKSKSLESAEKEVKDKIFHHEDITGFGYF